MNDVTTRAACALNQTSTCHECGHGGWYDTPLPSARRALVCMSCGEHLEVEAASGGQFVVAARHEPIADLRERYLVERTPANRWDIRHLSDMLNGIYGLDRVTVRVGDPQPI